ncbi:MAG TPA: helix-turn-helix domain-containing protein [Firmicutes bacterium]|nr:helix-turn-helix domain-containing protein [Bacillota bacterium]
MSEPRLVTAQELADMLKLSVETIWRYTRNSEIPYVQLSNRQYRYDPERVLRHLGMDQSEKSPTVVHEARPEYMTDKAYTYEDYLRLPDEEGYHYEILNGMLVKEPAPYVHHQRVSRRLHRLLEDYFTPKDPAGEVFNAPIDVTLSDTNVIQPDLVYIPGENSEIVEEARINGIPYLVVEILSKWTRSKDRLRKRSIYERMGIPHYWIVDPYDETIEAYALRNDLYVLRSSGLDVGEFTHPDFPGFSVDLAALWRRPE